MLFSSVAKVTCSAACYFFCCSFCCLKRIEKSDRKTGGKGLNMNFKSNIYKQQEDIVNYYFQSHFDPIFCVNFEMSLHYTIINFKANHTTCNLFLPINPTKWQFPGHSLQHYSSEQTSLVLVPPFDTGSHKLTTTKEITAYPDLQ